MSLHSQISGEGMPFLILHGFLGMGDNWKTLGTQFADSGYEVHLIDQRNHGRSFHSEEFSYEAMADDLYQYCLKHEVEECILLGHSMGGKTAMHFATKFPKRVSRLIIADIGPKAYPQHHQDILMALGSLDFKEIDSRGEADRVLAQSIPEFGVRQFLLKNLYWREKGVLALRMNLKTLTEKVEAIGEALPLQAVFDKPTLFIAGGKSGYIEPLDELLIHKHFPNSSIKTIANAGHWLHAEQPEQFFEMVIEFLEGSSSNRA